MKKDDYATIVGRRLARGANRKGFGNGGAVEALLNGPISTRQAERLLAWGNKVSWGDSSDAPPLPEDYYELTLEDVLGKRPDPSTSKAFAELTELVGLREVKDKVQQLMMVMQRMYDMEAKLEVPPEVPRLNRVLLGGPGTGKTTVARIFGSIMGECGFLSSGEVIMTKPSDFLGSYLGESEAKTAKILERAQGKVLVIDEAYGLAGTSPYHDAVQNALLSIPAEAGGDMCVLMAGYKEDMEVFLQNANQGLVRRMNFNSGSALEFHNYSVGELRRIIALAAAKKRIALPYDVAAGAARLLEKEAMLRNFGNADAAMALFEKLVAASVKREAAPAAAGAGGAAAPAAAVGGGSAKASAGTGAGAAQQQQQQQQQRTPASSGRALCQADLDAVIAAAQKSDLEGYSHPALETFVEELESTIATAHYLREAAPELPHCLFMGPPGTGKTTAARYLGRLLKDKGLLPRDDVVETTGEELVGSFVGQTKDKVKELLQKAQGGVLFIVRVCVVLLCVCVCVCVCFA